MTRPFGDTSEPALHLAISKLRAVEHRRYLVRATQSGVSAIIDPVGRIAKAAEPHAFALLVGDIGLSRGGTAYELTGDFVFYLLSVVALGIALLPSRLVPALGRRSPSLKAPA